MAASDTSATWSRFYHTLNCEAVKLRELMREAGISAPVAKLSADPGRESTERKAQHTHNHSTDSAAEKVEQ